MKSGRSALFIRCASVLSILLILGLPLPGAAAPAPAPATPEALGRIIDLSVRTGFQDSQSGHLQRGRAMVASDFDLDGRVDFYVGNPGDENYVMHNIDDGHGRFHFDRISDPAFASINGLVTWSATSLDYDNDGDFDLFVPIGGNETLGPPGDGIGFNHLFKNLWIETRTISFKEVTVEARIKGPVPPGETLPIKVAGAGAVGADVNLDGWTDIYESVANTSDTLPQIPGRDILWLNNGPDGNGVVTFTDVTDSAGLGLSDGNTRHSTVFDYDNDGDLDLYESNWRGANFLYRNMLKETQELTFVDVTAAESPPGEDLHYPWEAFGSMSTDLNNDGWQDILVFTRWQDGEPGSPYPLGHALFINQGVDLSGKHLGFVNVGDDSGVNHNFPDKKGVMGCQAGDLNGDGSQDIYVGNGAPMDDSDPKGGQYDQLFMSSQRPWDVMPRFTDATRLINFPAPKVPGHQYPPYPYRTHGTVLVDVDGDGTQEVAVAEGGPKASPDYVREPDRLFKFVWDSPPQWFIVHPVGDAVNVSRDAIGTRLALTVQNDQGKKWTIHRTLFGGSCFSAHNGYDIFFGLGSHNHIRSLEITWADGLVETRTLNDSFIGKRIEVDRRLVLGSRSTHQGHVATDTAAKLEAYRAAHPVSRYWLNPQAVTGGRLVCD